jgi:hypothetical protein
MTSPALQREIDRLYPERHRHVVDAARLADASMEAPPLPTRFDQYEEFEDDWPVGPWWTWPVGFVVAGAVVVGLAWALGFL